MGKNLNFTQAENDKYTDLYQEWELYLKPHGVKFPTQDTILGCALLHLYMNLGTYIHIDKIKKFVINKGFTPSGDSPQVRQLRCTNGFWVDKKGSSEHRLVTIEKKAPSYIREKRDIRLTSDIWNTLLKEYDYQCVLCGAEEGKPMRWDKTVVTKLQKGHMDPRKELNEANCIPQCSFCNQRYKNKAVFDKRGQVVELF